MNGQSTVREPCVVGGAAKRARGRSRHFGTPEAVHRRLRTIFARHAGRDVRHVRGSPGGGRTRRIPNRRSAVRVRAVRYKVRAKSDGGAGFARLAREAPTAGTRDSSSETPRARARCGRQRVNTAHENYSRQSRAIYDANRDGRRQKRVDKHDGPSALDYRTTELGLTGVTVLCE